MTEPLVCAVMLTRDRPQMAARAVQAFRSQTYKNRVLLVWDNGELNQDFEDDLQRIFHIPTEAYRDVTIGQLRNEATGHACRGFLQPDIFVHWDSDDWSHPHRIAEQVALLQASGKQAVGYWDLLFWQDEFHEESGENGTHYQAAWLYTNNDPRYCLGTSLCYWRSTWERRPFPDISRGEDKAWLREVDSMGVSSLIPDTDWKVLLRGPQKEEPRMIASIHSGNHVVYEPEKHPHNWKRVPEWDQHCRETMAL